MKTLLVLLKISEKPEIELFVRYFTRKLEFVSNILWMIVVISLIPLELW